VDMRGRQARDDGRDARGGCKCTHAAATAAVQAGGDGHGPVLGEAAREKQASGDCGHMPTATQASCNERGWEPTGPYGFGKNL
jgi:hypothetical protein